MLPPLSDHAAWEALASRKGWWRDELGEEFCKAFRATRADPSRVRRSVAERVADGLGKKLWLEVRSGVATTFRNHGRDIVDATVQYLYDKLDDPASTDGLALCLAFATIVRRRRIDHVRAAIASDRRSAILEIGSNGGVVGAPEVFTPAYEAPKSIDVEALLAEMPDERKRDAYRLRHVDGMQVQEIARKYGVTVRTINRWENETKDFLTALITKARDA